MADTSLVMPTAMVHEVREKAKASSWKFSYPGMIASFALHLWANDLWVPGPDIELEGDRYTFSIRLADEAFKAALKKKAVVDGVNISAIIRRALRDWLDGKWDLGLVRK